MFQEPGPAPGSLFLAILNEGTKTVDGRPSKSHANVAPHYP